MRRSQHSLSGPDLASARGGRWRLAAAWAVMLASGVAVTAAVLSQSAARMQDVLDMPVQAARFDEHTPTSSVARFGERAVAVGSRGVILRSSDGGVHWAQVASPVSADLVSVKFSDADTVWAVGHDAVALRSADGGATWQRMLDGRALLALLRSHYPERSGVDATDKVREEVERWARQSATPDVLPTPFLDVAFTDGNEGFLVGAFGLILHTADGGKRWTPWLERADNERRLHLYAVGGHGAQRYITGEQGLLMKLDRTTSRFVRIKTPYDGSYFGFDARPGRLLVYGLRGNAYASADEGRQWHKLTTGIEASFVAAVPASGDRLWLVSQAGHVLSVSADGREAAPVQVPYTSEVLGAAATSSGGLVLALVNGLRVLEIGAPAR